MEITLTFSGQEFEATNSDMHLVPILLSEDLCGVQEILYTGIEVPASPGTMPGSVLRCLGTERRNKAI